MTIINIGGEGEVPGAVNVQPPFALRPNWRSTTVGNPGKTVAELEAEGHRFVIAPNDALPFADGSVDVVHSNSVPVDVTTWKGPGVQSADVRRILKPGGRWVRTDADGKVTTWDKPV